MFKAFVRAAVLKVLGRGPRWRSLGCMAAMLLCAARSCSAQPPEYRSINRVVWLVQNIDAILPAWIAIGMTDIHKYPNLAEVGVDSGRPSTLYTWQVTGRLGNLTINFIQPAEGQVNSYNDFLGKHKDGIFAVVHEVPTLEVMNRETRRMDTLGVHVLQRVTMTIDQIPVTYTYFDTEKQGKYVLGLVYWPGGAPHFPKQDSAVSHLAPVTHDLAVARAYWTKLGFPGFTIEHASPRADSRYRGHPLSLAFEVGFQRMGDISYEWIQAPEQPDNIYEDFLRLHGEGIQHIGLPVPDLPASVDAYRKLGYEVWQAGAWGDVGHSNSGQYDYIDTDRIGGVAVELIHSY